MPIVVAGGLFVVLALALLAMSAPLLLRQAIAGPIDNAASNVSDVALVGGVLSWILSSLAFQIRMWATILDNLFEAARRDAYWSWNMLVTGTVDAFYSPWFSWIRSIANDVAWISGTVSYLINQAIPSIDNWISFLYDHVQLLAIDVARLVNGTIPNLYALIAALSWRTGNTEHAISSLETIALPAIESRVAQLEQSVGLLMALMTQVTVIDLPRLRDDVNERALEMEAEALRDRAGNLEQRVSQLWPLAALAVLDVASVLNLRCIAGVRCDPLSQLADADVDERLTFLEVDHG